MNQLPLRLRDPLKSEKATFITALMRCRDENLFFNGLPYHFSTDSSDGLALAIIARRGITPEQVHAAIAQAYRTCDITFHETVVCPPEWFVEAGFEFTDPAVIAMMRHKEGKYPEAYVHPGQDITKRSGSINTDGVMLNKCSACGAPRQHHCIDDLGNQEWPPHQERVQEFMRKVSAPPKKDCLFRDFVEHILEP